MRALAAQEAIICEDETKEMAAIEKYTYLVADRFYTVIGSAVGLPVKKELLRNPPHDNSTLVVDNESVLMDTVIDAEAEDTIPSHGEGHKDTRSPLFYLRKNPPTRDTTDILQTFLLSEAQGGVRVQPRLSDLILATTDVSKSMSAAQHFELGISLSKLGLYDLSQHHVMLSASPWDPMYHKLRYTLSLPHVFESMRSLARSIDNFEQQIEQYILRGSLRTAAVKGICNSFSDSGMVLGVLPLLHLAGYSAPRFELLMGQSPVAMPVLLSEFYSAMCSLNSSSHPNERRWRWQ